MRRGLRFPAWYLLLVAVLGILSGCQSLRDEDAHRYRGNGAAGDGKAPATARYWIKP